MSEKPSIYAIVVAAGSGRRAGGVTPKQYVSVAGKSMVRHSVEAFLAHPSISGVLVVADPAHDTHYKNAMAGLKLLPTVAGGAERADSVRAGLKALALHQPTYVLVHDAARPFLSRAQLDRIIGALAHDRGVIPALPVTDTVRRYEEGHWQEVPRDGLMRVQTPQAFPYGALVQIYHENAQPTDEAAAWLAAGRKLIYVEGDTRLEKITSPAELEQAMNAATRIATGMGYDVHALEPAGEKHVIRLGGIDIAHGHKLHGHSDADVVLHAVVDALLGALAEGDIGAHFPPSDPQWKGADSSVFVREALRKVHQHGGKIEHLDITLICEAPKIGPHRDAMRTQIAQLLSLPLNRVSLKATTTERLGFTGRQEGIACQAVATLKLPELAV